MPTIAAIVVPDPGYVYVETSWVDIPTATSVCVERVDTATGERFPLRPYVSYSADGCLDLSCGTAVFWDTEASFDTAYQYCATVTDAAGTTATTPATPELSATFSVAAAASWPPADTGQTWTNVIPLVDYSGTGTRGQQSTPLAAGTRTSAATVLTPNPNAQVTMFPQALALTQPTNQWIMLRSDAAGLNGYRLRLRYNTAGTVDLFLERVAAGVATTLSSQLAYAPYIAASGFIVQFRAWGSRLSAKVWDMTTPEPASVTMAFTDTTYTAPGSVTLSSQREAGNTNGSIGMQFDDLTVFDSCAEATILEICSGTVTIPGDECFRLGDPVRPCNDRHVCLSEESECSVEETGIYFGTMTPGTYGDNSGQLLPVNARRPIVVARDRRDVQSELVLVTRTFDDRDDVLALNEPGTPLLWRGPAGYGTGDRYMSVLDVGLSASFLDLQEEPRVVRMPHWAVDAPVGPSLGICGTRVDDLCDVYPTWDEVVAAGLTYIDLLRGQAGTGISVDLADWNDVNADFASWNALNAGESDWDDTLAGSP
jgi:hypothetical protein